MFRTILFSLVFFSFYSCSGTKNAPPIRVAFDSGYFSQTMQTVRMKGFFDEILLHLEKKLGFSVELVPAFPESLQDLLIKKKVDLIFSDLHQSIMMKKQFRFSEPLLYNGYYLVTNKEDRRGLKDLDTRRVLLLNNEEATVLIARYPRVDFGFYIDERDGFLQLSKSSCSGLLAPVGFFRLFETDFTIHKQEITDRNFSFIGLNTNEKIAQVFNELERMNKEGLIEAIKNRWEINP